MPAGRPSLYDPAYCDQVVELGKQGKSPVQIACSLNVDRGTMLGWAEAHPEFSTALTRAKAEEQNWWETVGQAALSADKFNSAVWSKSMSARFRDDYTERQKQEVSGPDGGPMQLLVGASATLGAKLDRIIVAPSAAKPENKPD